MNRSRMPASKILPPGSKRRIAAGRVKNLILHGTLGPNYKYKIWINKHEPQTLSPILDEQQLLISIVVPAYNTPKRYIDNLVESMQKQTYKNWQLCIADGSTDVSSASVIKQCCENDSRIMYIKVSNNLGISGNTNAAIKKARGNYIGFLDHDDILPAWSLNEIASTIKKHPDVGIIYSDEDRLTENGKTRMSPFFKPDWSPDLFLSANYVAHFFIIKKPLMDKLKGLRPEYDGSQDYDLALRALDYHPKIFHVPKILYHMRMAKGSTAKSIGEKDYVHDTGKRALENYFARKKMKVGVLEMPGRPTNHRIKYEAAGQPLVSIIIPFKDKVTLLRACLSSIDKTTYPHYEIIIISNNSKEKATLRYLEKVKLRENLRVFQYNKVFNYSAINNYGRSKATGKVLIFLNNDTEVINPEWLEELTAVAVRKDTGAVGALLLYPDKTIQHAGVILGLTGMAGHVFRKLKVGTLTPFWLPDWPRNYLAVTGACLAIEAKKFDSIGGFNEEFIMAGSDVVLGIQLSERGFRNVFWPFAKLIHHESKSVISYKNAPPSDYENSLKYYKPYLHYGDPYFNPNLNIESEIPIIRTKYE